MQSNQRDPYRNDPIFPTVPSSYYERMEGVLESLPTENRQAVSPRGIPKRRIIVLVAALVVLLTVGTAVAVSISRMQELRDRAQETVSDLQSVVSGKGGAMASEQDDAAPTPYVILSDFETDENGEWTPELIENLDVTETVGAFTLRLSSLSTDTTNGLKPTAGQLMATFWIEADRVQPCAMENVCVSINGGEPIRAWNKFESNPEWFDEHSIELQAEFNLPQHPLRPDTTFEFTGTLNEIPFTLTYAFTREVYEAQKAEQLDTLEAISEVLSSVPDETIPLNASIHGMVIEEVAIEDRYLYVVFRYDKDSRYEDAYEEYDEGIYAVVDGMLTQEDFIGSFVGEDGREHMLHRAYIPYAEAMPAKTLIAFFGTVFRVDWENGTATAPKDAEEFYAWRKESAELSAPDYGTDYVAKTDAVCDAFRVKELIYLNKSAAGQLAVILETDEPVENALYGRENQPTVTVNGITLDNQANYVQTPNEFSGGSADGGRQNGFWFFCPAYRTLPETFDVTVTWRGGSVTFLMHKSDFAAMVLDADAYDAVLNF